MLKDIIIGIKAYFNSFRLISELKLWKYFAIPMVISLLTAVIIGTSAYSFSDNIADYLVRLIPWEIEGSWAKTILQVLSAAIILLLGLMLFKHIIMALSAPFMSPVSEKIEAHFSGHNNHQHRDTNFTEQLWRGIRINIRNLLKELLFTIPILLLSFIPIVGLFTSIILFLLQAYYAGFGNIDYTLERHFDYRSSIQFVKKRRGLAIGNGIVFMLLLLVPVIGVLLVLPLSVTAASETTIKRLQLQTVE
jgi:CysZ protein